MSLNSSQQTIEIGIEPLLLIFSRMSKQEQSYKCPPIATMKKVVISLFVSSHRMDDSLPEAFTNSFMARDRHQPSSIAHHPLHQFWLLFGKTTALSPRVKHFVWRALTNSLACNAQRAATLNFVDFTCTQCDNGEETISDILLECEVSHETWQASFLMMSSSNITNAYDLFGCLCLSNTLPSQRNNYSSTPLGSCGKHTVNASSRGRKRVL